MQRLFKRGQSSDESAFGWWNSTSLSNNGVLITTGEVSNASDDLTPLSLESLSLSLPHDDDDDDDDNDDVNDDNGLSVPELLSMSELHVKLKSLSSFFDVR